MKISFAVWTLVLVPMCSSPSLLSAQHKPGPIAPAERLADGWEEIDPRLVFLMVRLANVEASLEVVDKATGKNTVRQFSKTNEARQAELGNERMDRNAGGPMKWQQFYGRTAEKFFYHPTDRNSTYHTTTVLSQQRPGADNSVAGGVPSRQGLPVHQRPPQFDYIYRANQNAKERAERQAVELKEKVAALLERRQRLEAEQSALWCEVAFRAVSHYDLDKKPIYRFEPVVSDTDTTSKRRAEKMKAAGAFMRLALSIIDEAQRDQSTAFSIIKPAVSDARQNLIDAWLRQDVDVTDRKTAIGKFAALAKRLDDVASNLSDSYVVSVEGDREKDQQRKDTFRALLQESLVSYAQIILALDEMSVLMQNDWKIRPNFDKPIASVSLGKMAATTNARNIETIPIDVGRESAEDVGRENTGGNRGSETYLIDLGPLEVIQEHGMPLSHWTVEVQGKKYPHSFPLYPYSNTSSHVAFMLRRRYRTFVGQIGINDSAKDCQTPLTFMVVGDRKPLWTSRPLTKSGELLDFSIDVKSVNKLELLVNCPGPANYNAAVWVEPRVLK